MSSSVHRLPTDTSVRLELDDVVVHLVVAVLGVVHRHHEDVTDTGHDVAGDGAAQHARTVQIDVSRRITQNAKDVWRRRFDPTGHANRQPIFAHSPKMYYA